MSKMAYFLLETKEVWAQLNEGNQPNDSEAAEIISIWFEYLILIQDFVERRRYY